MKMNELVEGGKGVADAIGLASKGLDYAGSAIKKLNPFQKGIETKIPFTDRPIVKPFEPTAYSGEVADKAREISKANKNANKLRQPAQQRVDAATDELKKLQGNKTDFITDKSGTTIPRAAREKELAGTIDADTAIVKANPDQAMPAKNDYSALRYTIPTLGANELVKTATQSSDDPDGISPLGSASKFAVKTLPTWMARGAKDIVTGPFDGSSDTGGMAASEKQPDSTFQQPPSADAEKQDSLRESLTDILKLSGQKSITSRDNIAGIVKPKEIVALHESKQIDECGMMPSTPNQTASLSINATAGNGQEVANMLAAIMNLAGVKPVTGDMLGSSPMPPMPIVKAIDIISRGDSDSMNGHHDHDHEGEEPLTGSMEEEYANTPKDPREVPELDTNKLAYQPNAVDVGDRMDGTMPKGFPEMTKESLLHAYTQFKNGQ